MAAPALRMRFADHDGLLQEFASNLQHGRAFVQGAHNVGVLEDCTLILVHPLDEGELSLPCQAVFVAPDPTPGTGLQLRPFDSSVIELLKAFVHPPSAVGAASPQQAPDGAEPLSDAPPDAAAEAELEAAPPEAHGALLETDIVDDPESSEDEASTPAVLAAEGEAEETTQTDVHDEAPGSDLQQQPSRQERLRKLNQTQQQKVARGSSLNDRVMLERLYGRNVWDALLHNPKLTIPEVATIARKGSVPRPLLEFIADNNTWIAAPIVRRALLGNPRVSSEAILKLLRLTPKHELKMIQKTTTYSVQIREAAKRVLETA